MYAEFMPGEEFQEVGNELESWEEPYSRTIDSKQGSPPDGEIKNIMVAVDYSPQSLYAATWVDVFLTPDSVPVSYTM